MEMETVSIQSKQLNIPARTQVIHSLAYSVVPSKDFVCK